MTTDVKMTLSVKADATAATRIRRELNGVRADFSVDTFQDLLLLVSELVTNASRHAGTGEDAEIRVTISSWKERTHVEVVDAGRGFRPSVTDVRPGDGGWGLQLVKRLSDRWGVERRDGCTVVWFDLVGDTLHALKRA
ncbi:MAG: ATP-binding protein [Actinobacteria bacterium]|nr:ATP-binding protein [Actinomycetota bacterium]